MTEHAAWTLFFKTGLPEAYLYICGLQMQDDAQDTSAFKTAFLETEHWSTKKDV